MLETIGSGLQLRATEEESWGGTGSLSSETIWSVSGSRSDPNVSVCCSGGRRGCPASGAGQRRTVCRERTWGTGSDTAPGRVGTGRWSTDRSASRASSHPRIHHHLTYVHVTHHSLHLSHLLRVTQIDPRFRRVIGSIVSL